MGAGKIILIIAAVVIVAVVALGALIGLNYERIREAAQKIKEGQSVALKPPAPLTPEQQQALEQFGRDLAAALTAKDPAAIKTMQDNEGLATRVFEQLRGISDERAVRRGFMKGISNRDGGWMSTLMEGEVIFLRSRERHSFPAVLLRMKTEDGGVSYVDVMVRPDGAGFKAVDMFSYIFANTTSEEARNVLAMLQAKSGVGGLAAMLGIPNMSIDKDVVSHFDALNKANQAGDAAEILRICDALPAELKTQRIFFIVRLQALMALSSEGSEKIDEEYKRALRAASGILGKDSATDLLMVDLLFMDKDYQGADEALQRVDAVVGGDPYLKFLRGNARLQMKDYEGALALANTAEKEDSSMVELVDLRINVHLERKDYKAVVVELRGLKQRFGVTLDRSGLTEEVYQDFLATPEFAAWEKEIATAP